MLQQARHGHVHVDAKVREDAFLGSVGLRRHDADSMAVKKLDLHCLTLSWVKCEGDGDVVGVVTPLGGVAQAFHGDQVVELRVQLAVQEVEGEEEDR